MESLNPSNKLKSLKHYLIEFLMLFAAVTLGFFAENFREDQMEKNRAKEYLELFKNEITRNNKSIDSVLNLGIPVLKKNERLYFSMLLDPYIPNKVISDSLDLMTYRFANDNRIFELMKNSGSLRYIKDKDLIQQINMYESDADFAEFRTFDQESSAVKLFWDFLVRKMPAELIVSWLGEPKFREIASMNPEYESLLSLHKDEIERRMDSIHLDDEVRQEFLKYLINKCSMQKLSIYNLNLLKQKSQPLLAHIDQYLLLH